MTAERLLTLALRVRSMVENNEEHAGLAAWEPSRPFLFGPKNRYHIRPVHAAGAVTWEVADMDQNGQIIRLADTFEAAVAGLTE